MPSWYDPFGLGTPDVPDSTSGQRSGLDLFNSSPSDWMEMFKERKRRELELRTALGDKQWEAMQAQGSAPFGPEQNPLGQALAKSLGQVYGPQMQLYSGAETLGRQFGAQIPQMMLDVGSRAMGSLAETGLPVSAGPGMSFTMPPSVAFGESGTEALEEGSRKLAYGAAAAQVADREMAKHQAETFGAPEGTVEEVAASLLPSAAVMGSYALHPAFGILMTGLPAAAPVYNEAVARGEDPRLALSVALAGGFIQGVVEQSGGPEALLAGKFAAKPFTNFLTRWIAATSTEGLEEYAQYGIDWQARAALGEFEGRDAKEVFDEFTSGAMKEAKLGFIIGGLLSAGPARTRAAVDHYLHGVQQDEQAELAALAAQNAQAEVDAAVGPYLGEGGVPPEAMPPEAVPPEAMPPEAAPGPQMPPQAPEVTGVEPQVPEVPEAAPEAPVGPQQPAPAPPPAEPYAGPVLDSPSVLSFEVGGRLQIPTGQTLTVTEIAKQDNNPNHDVITLTDEATGKKQQLMREFFVGLGGQYVPSPVQVGPQADPNAAPLPSVTPEAPPPVEPEPIPVEPEAIPIESEATASAPSEGEVLRDALAAVREGRIEEFGQFYEALGRNWSEIENDPERVELGELFREARNAGREAGVQNQGGGGRGEAGVHGGPQPEAQGVRADGGDRAHQGRAEGAGVPRAPIRTGWGDEVPVPGEVVYRGEGDVKGAPWVGTPRGPSHIAGTHYAAEEATAAHWAEGYGERGVVRAVKLNVERPFSTARNYDYTEVRDAFGPDVAREAARISGAKSADDPVEGNAVHKALVDEHLAQNGGSREIPEQIVAATESAFERIEAAGYDAIHHLVNDPNNPGRKVDSWATRRERATEIEAKPVGKKKSPPASEPQAPPPTTPVQRSGGTEAPAPEGSRPPGTRFRLKTTGKEYSLLEVRGNRILYTSLRNGKEFGPIRFGDLDNVEWIGEEATAPEGNVGRPASEVLNKRSKPTYTEHGKQRVRELRGVTIKKLWDATQANGVVVEDYPDWHLGPAVLVKVEVNGSPLHVVWGQKKDDMKGAARPRYLVTVYKPDATKWNDDFTQRVTEEPKPKPQSEKKKVPAPEAKTGETGFYESYDEAKEQAQVLADRHNKDAGILKGKQFGKTGYTVSILPPPEASFGPDARAERVPPTPKKAEPEKPKAEKTPVGKIDAYVERPAVDPETGDPVVHRYEYRVRPMDEDGYRVVTSAHGKAAGRYQLQQRHLRNGKVVEDWTLVDHGNSLNDLLDVRDFGDRAVLVTKRAKNSAAKRKAAEEAERAEKKKKEDRREQVTNLAEKIMGGYIDQKAAAETGNRLSRAGGEGAELVERFNAEIARLNPEKDFLAVAIEDEEFLRLYYPAIYNTRLPSRRKAIRDFLNALPEQEKRLRAKMGKKAGPKPGSLAAPEEAKSVDVPEGDELFGALAAPPKKAATPAAAAPSSPVPVARAEKPETPVRKAVPGVPEARREPSEGPGPVHLFDVDLDGREGEARSVDIGGQVLHPVPLPELLEIIREGVGLVPKVLKSIGRGILGRFYKGRAGAAIEIAKIWAADPQQLAAAIAHEAGHAVDYFPDESMAKGSLFGRLIGQFRRAKKIFFTADGKKFKEDELRDELLALSDAWRPGLTEGSAKTQAYRRSPTELYGDFISALLRRPDLVNKYAPKALRLFIDHMNSKPDFLDAYEAVQNRIADGDKAVFDERRRRAVGVSREGRLKRMQQVLRNSKEASLREGVAAAERYLGRQFIDAFSDLYRVARHAGERIKGPLAEAIRKVDALRYTGTAQADYLERVHDLFARLPEIGVSWDDLALYLQYRRSAFDRAHKGVVSPGGASAVDYQQLAQRLGKEKVAEIEKLASDWHALRIEHVIEPAIESGLVNRKLGQKMRMNVGYVRFYVQSYLDKKSDESFVMEQYGHNPFKAQQGTFQDIGDVLMETMWHDAQIIRAASLNQAVRDSVSALSRFGSEVRGKKKGRYVFTRGGYGAVHFYENGILHSAAVREGLADAFRKHGPGHDAALAWSTFDKVHNVVRGLMVTYNPAWAVGNIIRDLKAFGRNVVATKEFKAGHKNEVTRYLSGIFAPFIAAKWVLGVGRKAAMAEMKARKAGGRSALRAEMEKERALIRTRSGLGGISVLGESELGEREARTMPIDFLRALHSEDHAEALRDRNALGKFWRAFLRKARYVGETGELATKFGGYLYLKEMQSRIQAKADALTKEADVLIAEVEKAQGLTKQERADRKAEIKAKLAAKLEKEAPVPENERIAELVRSRVGTPDVRRRGAAYWLYNRIFMFSNVGKEGWRSSYEAFRDDPAMYATKVLTNVVRPKLVLAMALAGWFDDDKEEKGKRLSDQLRKIPTYRLKYFHVIPLGVNESGKVEYLSMPTDHITMALGGYLFDLLGGKDTWLGGNGDLDSADMMSLWRQILNDLPYSPANLHPALDTVWNMTAFAMGQNPWDYFRNRPLLPESLAESRSSAAYLYLGRQLAEGMGLGIFTQLKPDFLGPGEGLYDTLIKIPGAGQLVRRFYGVTDYGDYEALQEVLREKGQRSANEREVRNMIMHDFIERGETDFDKVWEALGKSKVQTESYKTASNQFDKLTALYNGGRGRSAVERFALRYGTDSISEEVLKQLGIDLDDAKLRMGRED